MKTQVIQENIDPATGKDYSIFGWNNENVVRYGGGSADGDSAVNQLIQHRDHQLTQSQNRSQSQIQNQVQTQNRSQRQIQSQAQTQNQVQTQGQNQAQTRSGFRFRQRFRLR